LEWIHATYNHNARYLNGFVTLPLSLSKIYGKFVSTNNHSSISTVISNFTTTSFAKTTTLDYAVERLYTSTTSFTGVICGLVIGI